MTGAVPLLLLAATSPLAGPLVAGVAGGLGWLAAWLASRSSPTPPAAANDNPLRPSLPVGWVHARATDRAA